jgi:hypothetical protein
MIVFERKEILVPTEHENKMTVLASTIRNIPDPGLETSLPVNGD